MWAWVAIAELEDGRRGVWYQSPADLFERGLVGGELLTSHDKLAGVAARPSHKAREEAAVNVQTADAVLAKDRHLTGC
jgi:hypothetical protein